MISSKNYSIHKRFGGVILVLAAFFILAFSSCKSSKTTATVDPIKDRSAGYLLKRYERNRFEYDWMGMKLDVDLKKLGETTGFKANIRMKKDSAIWISISPALGIEVFRVLITPDSLKYISKLPDDKYYYAERFDKLTELARVDFDFEMLQELLVGNAIGLEKDEGKFRTSIDNNQYLLVSKYKRRVRRVVGVDDRKLSPTDTIIVNPNDPRYQRTVRKADDENLIVSRYWLDPSNFKLVHSIFNDLINQRTVEITYEDFKEENEQTYPTRCVLDVKEAGGQQQIEFRTVRIATDKTYEFPFEIAPDLERKITP